MTDERGSIPADIAAVQAGPFTSVSTRDVFHARIRALELAKSCFDDQTVSGEGSLVGLAGIFWEFIEKGVTSGPTEGELASAVAYRQLQEMLVAMVGKSK